MNNFLIIVTLIFLYGCGTGEPVSGLTHHIFRNETDYNMEAEGFFDGIYSDSFSLKPKEEYIWIIPARDGEDNRPFRSTLFQFKDSVLIIF